ncbi:MAG: DNA primase [Enterobacteriaceae bacterium]|nr:DNA primase [Enterobacteriaceae bacterium]
MTKYVEKDFISKLFSEVNIIELINDTIKLEKKGKYYFGLCPFHDEKTSSFIINEERKQYYCFGCGCRGDVFQFFMNYKNISFVESVKLVANFFSIKLPENNNDNDNDNDNNNNNNNSGNNVFKKKINYYSLMNNITFFYNVNLKDCLLSKNKIYNFCSMRNLSISILNRFNVGFGSGKYLNKNVNVNINDSFNSIVLDELKIFELVINKNKIIFDRFRNRIVFPIKNEHNCIIGFGGRVIDENLKPKYINSSDSFFFHKSDILYGLYEAKKCELFYKQIKVVEGFIEVINLHQNGIKNVVSTLGTSLTMDHLKLLKSFTKEIVFCYDGDIAGLSAAWRSANICLFNFSNDISIRFVFLQRNEDPDSFIRFSSKSKFLKLLSKSISIFDYVFKNISLNFNLNTIDGRFSFTQKIMDLFKHISSDICKKLIYDHISNFFQLSYDELGDLKNSYSSTENNEFGLHVSFVNNKNYNNFILSPCIKASILLIRSRILLLELDKFNFFIKLFSIFDYDFSLDFKTVNFFENLEFLFDDDLCVFIKIAFTFKSDVNISIFDLGKRISDKLKFLSHNFVSIIDSIPLNGIKIEFLDTLNIILKNNYDNRKINKLILK